MADDIALLLEQNALRALAAQYASGVDARDSERFVACFTDDATLDIFNPWDAPEPVTAIRGHQELAEVPRRMDQNFPRTLHFVGQSTYEIGEGTATGEVYCIAHHFTHNPRGGTDYVMYIRYDDRYRKGDDGKWRFEARRVNVDWTETRVANPLIGH
jgi:hypothetical protein